MELVLLSLNIVLQEDLDLRGHLWAYVFQEETSNDSQTSEAKGRERDDPKDKC